METQKIDTAELETKLNDFFNKIIADKHIELNEDILYDVALENEFFNILNKIEAHLNKVLEYEVK